MMCKGIINRTEIWRDIKCLLICVNYSDHQSQCYVRLDDISDGEWQLKDLMSDINYIRDGNEMKSRGLYLDMKQWQYHVFEMKKISAIS